MERLAVAVTIVSSAGGAAGGVSGVVVFSSGIATTGSSGAVWIGTFVPLMVCEILASM